MMRKIGDQVPAQKFDGKNMFGGGNPHGLYVPLSEDEQEVIARLVEAEDLEVIVKGIGKIEKPKIVFGDLRISLGIHISFGGSPAPRPIHFFDLELRTRSGQLLFKKREPISVNGQPLQVVAGMEIDMAWDIALHHIDPKIVKALKPGAVGLTSRRQDKDTKDFTPGGNMRLDGVQQRVLQQMEEGARQVQQNDLKKVIEATQASGQEIKRTTEGLEAPDVG